MRTNYKNLWMLAAILFCGLAMTSCDDVLDVIDNPTTTETEQALAQDPGIWWIDENNMDKSVKPGDNFFMYCNGTWWKNTSVNPLSNITSRLSLMKPTFSQRVNSLTDANYDIYKSHLKWADDGSEAAIAGQNLFDGVLKQSGLMEATTSIDVMRAFGKMAAMGACSCLKLEPFCYNNKVCLYVSYNNEDFIEGGDETTTMMTTMIIAPLGAPSGPRSGRSSTRIPMRWPISCRYAAGAAPATSPTNGRLSGISSKAWVSIPPRCISMTTTRKRQSRKTALRLSSRMCS